MSKNKTRSYPEAFRREAVKLADQPGRTAAEVAKELGIPFPILTLSTSPQSIKIDLSIGLKKEAGMFNFHLKRRPKKI